MVKVILSDLEELTGLDSITKSKEISPPPEWKDFLEKIEKGDRIMVIGEPDSGKTTFCRYISRWFRNAVLIDSDPGQQNIFLPSTIAVKHGERVLKFFVGKFSPRGVEGIMITALGALMRHMEGVDAEIMLLDTSGYISEDGAVFLKFAKCMVFRPTKIVVLTPRFQENKSYIEKFKKMVSQFYQVFELPPSERARVVSREERERIRIERIQRYFSEAEELEIRKDENVVNLKIFQPREDGIEIVGFFYRGLTEFMGLVQNEDEHKIRVKVPRRHKNWDLVIRSYLKVKI